ncbi:hypothetical protein Anas_09869 [Armadillidium nasatum]|uniref:Uncharacterized protein n=1 Tax=Armadillidium nasatum TaxID=96803 RepID=A0A5N5T137_9CRUS|nr:hypothetical protein Anas_09869 [Armadillidium nasatum]
MDRGRNESGVREYFPAPSTTEETITFEMKTISYNFGFYDYDLEEVVVLNSTDKYSCSSRNEKYLPKYLFTTKRGVGS